MITYAEAQKLIEQNSSPGQAEEIFLSASLGYVSAENIHSPLPLPLFDNSAMDGFMLRSEETLTATTQTPVFLNIRGVIKAGDSPSACLGKQEAYRIMTGAPIIKGSDAVLEKEKAEIQNNQLVLRAPVPKGRNVRFKGEEIKKRELVLPKNSVIRPGTIGFLASIGRNKIKIYRKPRIALIATGSELVTPGSPLKPGKIYDSNTAMLCASLDEMRIYPVFVRRLTDQPKIIQKVLAFALKQSDILILTGGVSVGEYDYVKELLQKSGVETIFWKVSQKPGKPLYFGRKENSLVFGLPGNPASVFTCFYEYAYPAIRRFMGYKNPSLFSARHPLKGSLKPDPEKILFVKSKIEAGEAKQVVPLKHQQSHMISSLCEADSLIVVPSSQKMLEENDLVLVHALPSLEG